MEVYFGSQTFRLFCVGCHGPDGRGNAAVGRALLQPDVDLSQIARRNGGVFPAEDVATAITGLGGTGHARLKMAPWAEVFADEFDAFTARAVVNQMVERRIDHLVAYIESIQEK